MNIEEFDEKYKDFGWKDKIKISCEDCNQEKELLKHKAKENVTKNHRYSCQKCRALQAQPSRVYSPEGLAAISKGTSYPRSEETKAKMSAGRKAYFKTEAGKEFKRRLSIMTAMGHAQNKFENAKRQGWYPSTKTGKLMFYGSSYELRLCWMLDQDSAVETYQTQIVYEWDGRGRCLDFLVTFIDGTIKAIEVKPEDRLNEESVILQIGDSNGYASSQGWQFGTYTEAELGMTPIAIREWADKYRETITGIDYTSHRMQINRDKANKHYATKIATDTVTLFCAFCNVEHTALRLTHEKNIERNGRYICEREGGHIAGSKPKKKKDNPHAAEGKKKCNRCEQVKLLEEFGDDKMKSDGKATRCKECRAEVATAKYQQKRAEKPVSE
jgi:hypothetical protein